MYVPKRPMYTSKRILMETPSKETYVCTNVERKIYIESFYVYIKETCKRDLLAHSHTWRVTRVCVAVCCSVLLQCVAVCCIVSTYLLICISGGHTCLRCSVLQCVAVCCSVLIYVLICIPEGRHVSILQCVAACCSVLQRVDLLAHLRGDTCLCCSELQRVAVYCSVLQRVDLLAHART